MKMKIKRIAGVLCALFLALSLSGCGIGLTAALAEEVMRGDSFRQFCREAELDLSKAQVLSDQDSHGGFHGDGVRLVKVKFHWDTKWSAGPALCPYDRAREAMAKWGEPDYELLCLLYGEEEITDGFSAERGPYIPYEEDMEPIPPVRSGYFYLEDRYLADGPQAGEAICDRGAFNFTVAVYDLETDILYYCEVDT